MSDKFVFLSQFYVNFRKVTLGTGVPLENNGGNDNKISLQNVVQVIVAKVRFLCGQ